METYLNRIIANYLIMPVIAVIMGAVAIVIAKKNHFLTKKMIVYFLSGCIILVLPSILGLFTYNFMPYGYLLLQLFYLVAGGLNLLVMDAIFEESVRKYYTFEIVLILVMTVVSMAFFSVFFNLCNKLHYGIWASTCLLPFCFVSVYRKACRSFLNIPVEVYKLWHYSSVPEWGVQDKPDYPSMFVIDIELTRNPGETNPFKLTAKVAGNMNFGQWFQCLLDEYNKKASSNPVQCYDGQESYGWVFYVKHSYFHARRYIDPDMTFSMNNLKRGYTVVARRAFVTNKEN